MLEAATSDRKIPVARAALPEGRRAARPLLLHDQHGPPLHGGPRRARAALLRARGGDRLGLPALPRAQAAGQRLRLRRPAPALEAAARREPRGGRAARAPPTTTSSWTSTRTPTASRATSSTGWRGSRRNVTVVGDDAQAIYSFRGASFENILGFPERYPEAKTFRLTRNYRSTPEILALANASIAQNERQFPKELAAAREAGPLPAVVALPDIPDQARFVGAAPARVARRGGEARRTSPSSTARTTRRWSCRSS